MSENRDKIAARMRALAAKTVENGCTEDEAIAAAKKLAEMLEKYNMTLDEVELRESPFKKHQDEFRDEVSDRLWKVASAIAELTGSRYWTSPAGVSPIQINFFGFAHEVEVSQYMLSICHRAMRDRRDELMIHYGLLVPARRRAKMLPFFDGMADSLARRIRALIPPRPTGTGLVVLRGELIDQEMKDSGIAIRQANKRQSRDLDREYRDGWEAGERVPLHQGVRSNTDETLRIR